MVRRPLGKAYGELEVTVLSLLLSAVLAVSAHGQQASTPAQSPTGVLTDQELAISVHNPFEDFVKVPVQSTTGFESIRIITPAIV